MAKKDTFLQVRKAIHVDVAAKNGKDWAICGGAANRKRLFGASFIPKTIILPRQARDKDKFYTKSDHFTKTGSGQT